MNFKFFVFALTIVSGLMVHGEKRLGYQYHDLRTGETRYVRPLRAFRYLENVFEIQKEKKQSPAISRYNLPPEIRWGWVASMNEINNALRTLNELLSDGFIHLSADEAFRINLSFYTQFQEGQTVQHAKRCLKLLKNHAKKDFSDKKDKDEF